MFKPVLLSCAALLVAGTQLSTDYSPDKGFKVEVLTELSMKTTSSSFERDGEPVEGRGGGSGDMASSMKHQAVIVDTIVAVKEGKPSKLTRSFESLSGASTMSFGGEETTRDAEPQLDGVTLTLARAENGEIEAKVTEGTSPSSSDCLEGHRLELALDALLPEGEVADGASWELDKDAVRRALGLDMEKAYFPRAAPTEGDSPRGGGGGGGGGRFRGGMGGGGDSRVLDLADWEGTATLTEEKVEHGGVACRVITIELKAKGDMPEQERTGGGRRGQALGLSSEAVFGTSYAIELEGKLFFSVADKRPVAFVVEGSVGVETDTERTMGESTMRIRSTREGTYKHSVEVSRP
jgi:hypothetical protein